MLDELALYGSGGLAGAQFEEWFQDNEVELRLAYKENIENGEDGEQESEEGFDEFCNEMYSEKDMEG